MTVEVVQAENGSFYARALELQEPLVENRGEGVQRYFFTRWSEPCMNRATAEYEARKLARAKVA